MIDKAADVAGGYVEKKENVVNLLKQQEGVASNQVMLRVRFAEVSRSAMQELGASFILSQFKSDWYARATTQQFPAPNFDSDKPGGQILDHYRLPNGKDDVDLVDGTYSAGLRSPPASMRGADNPNHFVRMRTTAWAGSGLAASCDCTVARRSRNFGALTMPSFTGGGPLAAGPGFYRIEGREVAFIAEGSHILFAWQEPGRIYEARISFTATATAFNGKRQWFCCPACHKPCRVLHSKRLSCRRCLDIRLRLAERNAQMASPFPVGDYDIVSTS